MAQRVTVPYSEAWPEQFQKERVALQRALAPWLSADIEHVGSTSVPGMNAKPVIDMIAGVANLQEAAQAAEPLRKLDYHLRPHRPDALLFDKPGAARWQAHTHHLHLAQTDSDIWRERLAFRDALRADPALVREYNAWKAEHEQPNDDAAYSSSKTPFVARVLATRGIALKPDDERLTQPAKAPSPSIFRGTAPWYAKFRRGYPPSVIELLRQQADLDSTSRVLDIGCGTGQVTLDLAPLVGSVTGVDVDPDMLAEAASAADRRGLKNCRWLLSPAEALPLDYGAYDLVVIASAFHWMDRDVVAAKVHAALVPQGVLAVLGSPGPLDQVTRREGIGGVIAEVEDRWFPPDAFPQGSSTDVRHEAVLARSPFGSAEVSYHPVVEEWDVDSFLGFLRSTSLRPDQILGERFNAFADDLRTAIFAVHPDGRWTVENRVEVILARKDS